MSHVGGQPVCRPTDKLGKARGKGPDLGGIEQGQMPHALCYHIAALLLSLTAAQQQGQHLCKQSDKITNPITASSTS